MRYTGSCKQLIHNRLPILYGRLLENYVYIFNVTNGNLGIVLIIQLLVCYHGQQYSSNSDTDDPKRRLRVLCYLIGVCHSLELVPNERRARVHSILGLSETLMWLAWC